MAYQNAFYDTDDYEIVAAGSMDIDKEPLKNIIADISFDLSDLIDDIEKHGLAKDEKKLLAAISHVKANFKKMDEKIRRSKKKIQ